MKEQQKFASRTYFDYCQEADPTVTEADLTPTQHTILSAEYEKLANKTDLKVVACQFEVDRLTLQHAHAVKYFATQKTADAEFRRIREETAAGRARQAKKHF